MLERTAAVSALLGRRNTLVQLASTYAEVLAPLEGLPQAQIRDRELAPLVAPIDRQLAKMGVLHGNSTSH